MKTIILALCLAAVCASAALAQPAPSATLRVTVVDPSNAVVVGATVTVIGAELGTRSASVPVVEKTADTGHQQEHPPNELRHGLSVEGIRARSPGLPEEMARG